MKIPNEYAVMWMGAGAILLPLVFALLCTGLRVIIEALRTWQVGVIRAELELIAGGAGTAQQARAFGASLTEVAS